MCISRNRSSGVVALLALHNATNISSTTTHDAQQSRIGLQRVAEVLPGRMQDWLVAPRAVAKDGVSETKPRRLVRSRRSAPTKSKPAKPQPRLDRPCKESPRWGRSPWLRCRLRER